MIEIDGLGFTYPDGTVALADIDLTFDADDAFAVLGESGSGKTTLLRCMGRFLSPTVGSIHIDGEDIAAMDEPTFRSTVGLVFQQQYLFPHLDVLGNMTLALREVQGVDKHTADKRALGTLDRLGIADLAGSYPAQISGGQGQRVAIARGLVLEPLFMLLDEPTSALDANTTDEFAAWLRELRDRTRFVIVTHDTLFAAKVAPRGVYLSNGRIADTGKIDTIIAHVRAGEVTADAPPPT